MIRKAKFYLAVLSFTFALFILLNGCGPTYPKERFKESIVKVCKGEYKLDVKVETIGKTIAIYAPLSGLLDITFAITKTAAEKINNIILSVSRVALSTDAKYDFYCVIAHDIRMPEVQIVIIKTVDDVRRFLLGDISRDEYSKRMLVDIRLSPQAQKEHDITQAFEKTGVDKKLQEAVMDDFFRSEPAAMGDIGYWNNRFYIKDISLPEFLAEQIANRVRIEFREDNKLSGDIAINFSKGAYVSKDGKKYFRFEIAATPSWIKEIKFEDVRRKVFLEALNVISRVIRGYKFYDFDYIEILNQSDGNILKLTKDELEDYRIKKITFEDIMNRNVV